MKQLRHAVQCTQIDHDNQQVQYICIEPTCTQKQKGMCEICKFGNHWQHTCIEVKKLDELLVKSFEQEKQFKNNVYCKINLFKYYKIKTYNTKHVAIQYNYLYNSFKKSCYKQCKNLKRLVKLRKKNHYQNYYLKHINDKLNLEEYNEVRTLVMGNLDQFFGEYFWKKEMFICITITIFQNIIKNIQKIQLLKLYIQNNYYLRQQLKNKRIN